MTEIEVFLLNALESYQWEATYVADFDEIFTPSGTFFNNNFMVSNAFTYSPRTVK